MKILTPVYVAFELAGNGLIDEGISLFDHGKFCHAEVVMNDGRTFRSHLIGGCRWVENITYDGHWVFVPVELENYQRAYGVCDGMDGDPYDLWGVLLFVVRWLGLVSLARQLEYLKPPRGKFFCSMSVAKIVSAGGGPFFAHDDTIGPDDLFTRLASLTDLPIITGSDYERARHASPSHADNPADPQRIPVV
jgi:hypothetical protein